MNSVEARQRMQQLLQDVLETNHVYYQPPETIRMTYPAIVYELASLRNLRANDGKYLTHYIYKVTLISRDPDTPIFDRLDALEKASFSTSYKVDNLNHFSFTIQI